MILPPLTTPYLGIPYPDRGANPFWDEFEAMVLAIESQLFYSKVFGNMWMAGGGTRVWDGTQGLLTWSDDFVIPIPNSGFKINVRFGPDGMSRTAGISDGQYLVVSMQMGMVGNVVVNFAVMSQLDKTRADQFVCGVRSGNSLLLRGLGEFT